MIIKFQKFQGAGNDFIIIDNRNQVYEFTREIVEYFCDRKFGIGADGLMLLETCPGYDFKMRYFNSDGREACLPVRTSLPKRHVITWIWIRWKRGAAIAWACFCKPPVSWQQTVNIRAKLPSRAYGLK